MSSEIHLALPAAPPESAGDPSAPSKNRVGTDRASRAVAASATSANAVPRIANTRLALGALRLLTRLLHSPD